VTKTLRVAPPNSLIFVRDEGGGVVPEFVPNRLVLATSSAVSVGCLAEMDGETEVTLGPIREIETKGLKVFDDVLETPTRRIVVETSEGEILLREDVASNRVRVCIWVNRVVEPDRILVGWERIRPAG
jgi:hypothetical protein